MSHVAVVDDIEITNLDDLKAAVKDLGMEWREGQAEYEWFGEHIGDYPLPPGFEIHDLGKCEHAIAQGDSARITAIQRYGCAWEIGVVRRRDGKPGWQLLWDFYEGGNGLADAVGQNANKLRQAIANAASIRTMSLQGFRVAERVKLPNGTIRLQFSRG